jgi:hypothetical protein
VQQQRRVENITGFPSSSAFKNYVLFYFYVCPIEREDYFTAVALKKMSYHPFP